MSTPQYVPGDIVRSRGTNGALRLVRPMADRAGDWYLSRDLTGTAGADWDHIAHEQTFTRIGPTREPADLTSEEHAALNDYATRHGRRWKDDLRTAWMNASETGILQQLRNSARFGPRGLIRYRPTDRAL